MFGLSKLFGHGFQEPKAVSKVHGFEISVEKKDGTLLKAEASDDRDTSSDSYYEVSVRATGANPEYPEQEQPSLHRFTKVGYDNPTMGSKGGVQYISHTSSYEKFTLQEEFDDAEPKREMGGIIYKKAFEPHHSLMLAAKCKHSDGSHSELSIQLRVRESQRPDWEATMTSDIYAVYMG